MYPGRPGVSSQLPDGAKERRWLRGRGMALTSLTVPAGPRQQGPGNTGGKSFRLLTTVGWWEVRMDGGDVTRPADQQEESPRLTPAISN